MREPDYIPSPDEEDVIVEISDRLEIISRAILNGNTRRAYSEIANLVMEAEQSVSIELSLEPDPTLAYVFHYSEDSESVPFGEFLQKQIDELSETNEISACEMWAKQFELAAKKMAEAAVSIREKSTESN